MSGFECVRVGEDVDKVLKMWSGCESVCCRNVLIVKMSNVRPEKFRI